MTMSRKPAHRFQQPRPRLRVRPRTVGVVGMAALAMTSLGWMAVPTANARGAVSTRGAVPAPAAAAVAPVLSVAARVSRGPIVMPFGTAGVRSAQPAAASTTPHLDYSGGRVISNVAVAQVLYGTGNYLPQTTSQSSPSVGSFYSGVTKSPYIDWLSMYNTTIPSGTGQSIGRGRYLGQSRITPAAGNDGSFFGFPVAIQDSNIQAELAAQIDAGKVPKPSTDSHGNPNTLYAIFFPQGKSICLGNTCSLVAGGFCAYHNAFTHNGVDIYYSVHPDLTGQQGCGRSNDFANTTSVASHEMVEAITDPVPPNGWYDRNHSGLGEIGDICNAQQGMVTGGDGVTYTVQKQWSNADSKCIVTSSSAPLPPSGGITNGSFDTGDLTGWTTSGPAASVVSPGNGTPHAALLGSTNATLFESSISQTFTAPTGTSHLSFSYQMTCPDGVQWDWATATLADNTAGTTAVVLPHTCATSSSWTNVSGGVVAGHSYTVTLTNRDDNDPRDPTRTLFDNVTVS